MTDLTAELGITLNYLPPYSPNLNLIERLWKFVKGRICNIHFDDFHKFKGAIDSIIDETGGRYKNEINTLIDKPICFPDDGNQHWCAAGNNGRVVHGKCFRP